MQTITPGAGRRGLSRAYPQAVIRKLAARKTVRAAGYAAAVLVSLAGYALSILDTPHW